MRLIAYQLHLLLVNAVAGMLAVSAGWHAYEVTRDPMSIGLIGLIFFATALTCFLPSGMASDKFNKRSVILAAQLVTMIGCWSLAWWRAQDPQHLSGLYLGVLFAAIGRSFESPASSSMLPELIQGPQFPRMVAISTSIKQIAKVGGPLLAGFLLAVKGHEQLVYLVCIGITAVEMLILLLFIRPQPRGQKETSHKTRGRDLLLGVRYVFSNRLLLGALFLDLLAGLFGNLTALLPIFVAEVLQRDADTLGLLRSSIAFGSFAASLCLGLKSLPDQIGRYLIGSVMLLGAVNASLVTAHSAALAWMVLFAFGAIDSISVYIRQTLVQLATPRALRGRVTAANQLSIVISNQLGEFRSGSMAAWVGLQPTILIGGFMTMVFALAWPRLFPEVWRLRSFSEAIPKDE